MSNEPATQRSAEQHPVRVAELLAKHQGDHRAGTSSSAQHDSEHKAAPDSSAGRHSEPSDALDSPLRREGHPDEDLVPDRPTGMYRAVSALAGIAVFCAAVAASITALSGPRAVRAIPDDPATTSITGADVVRPDLLNESIQLPPLATTPTPAADQAPGSPVDARTLPGTDDIPRPAPQGDIAAPGHHDPQLPPNVATEPSTDPDANSSSGTQPAQQNQVLDTVIRFYETATVSPRQAFGLLNPQMQGPSYQDFKHAWDGVVRTTVHSISPDGPNAALVMVSLERKDGSVLHTLQRVLVTPGPQPRIADARLLSASRT